LPLVTVGFRQLKGNVSRQWLVITVSHLCCVKRSMSESVAMLPKV